MLRLFSGGRLYLLLTVIGGLLAWLLFGSHYQFPSLGLSFFFITLASLAFYFKPQKTRFDTAIFIICCILSSFLFFRSNEFLTFLNIIGLFYFGSVLLRHHAEQNSLLQLILSPVLVFFSISSTKNKHKLNMSEVMKQENRFMQKIPEHLPAIGISLLILIVTIPLLSYANPIFATYVNDFFGFFNLSKFFENFSLTIVRVLFIVFFLVFIPRMLTFVEDRTPGVANVDKNLMSMNLLIPKIVLAVVLTLFFISQVQLYFASKETLAVLGYTNSQFAREVFGQLSVVALIIFGLVYADKRRNTINSVLTYILIAQGIFLDAIALKSVYDYSSNWGFTHKRLYGYAFVLWTFLTLVLFSFFYYRQKTQHFFVKSFILLSGCIFLGINIANFDYLIYHTAKPTVHGIDHVYLGGLSTDADSYSEHLEQLMKEIRTKDQVSYAITAPAHRIIFNIELLRKKYDILDIGSFNLSEYIMYRKTKNVQIDEFKKMLQAKIIYENVGGLEVQRKDADPFIVAETITLQVESIPGNLFNHNYVLKDSNGAELQRGSLDDDRLYHSYGPGKFSITIYSYDYEGNTAREVPEREIIFDITPDDIKAKEKSI